MNVIDASLQFVQRIGGHHPMEDAGWCSLDDRAATIVVADGASVRLPDIKSLQTLQKKYVPQYGPDITPSGIASRLIRDTVAGLSASFPQIPLSDMILQANQHLADALAAIYGELSAAAVLKAEPQLTLLQDDERLLRLTLPVSTYALVRANWHTQTLEMVQGADAAVFVMYRDGRFVQVTPDQMAQHDAASKEILAGQPDAPAQHPFFQQMGDSRSTEVNRLNGIYHNYVGLDGELDPTVGVSVVNGLPQVADYMFKAQMPLADIQAVVVTSDGLFWPESPDETESAAQQRVQHMGERILRDGLNGYLDALRAEETHLRESGINPHQKHDDATGALLVLHD